MFSSLFSFPSQSQNSTSQTPQTGGSNKTSQIYIQNLQSCPPQQQQQQPSQSQQSHAQSSSSSSNSSQLHAIGQNNSNSSSQPLSQFNHHPQPQQIHQVPIQFQQSQSQSQSQTQQQQAQMNQQQQSQQQQSSQGQQQQQQLQQQQVIRQPEINQNVKPINNNNNSSNINNTQNSVVSGSRLLMGGVLQSKEINIPQINVQNKGTNNNNTNSNTSNGNSFTSSSAIQFDQQQTQLTPHHTLSGQQGIQKLALIPSTATNNNNNSNNNTDIELLLSRKVQYLESLIENSSQWEANDVLNIKQFLKKNYTVFSDLVDQIYNLQVQVQQLSAQNAKEQQQVSSNNNMKKEEKENVVPIDCNNNNNGPQNGACVNTNNANHNFYLNKIKELEEKIDNNQRDGQLLKDQNKKLREDVAKKDFFREYDLMCKEVDGLRKQNAILAENIKKLQTEKQQQQQQK